MTYQNNRTHTVLRLSKQLVKSFRNRETLQGINKPMKGSVLLVDFAHLDRLDKCTLDFLKVLRKSAFEGHFKLAFQGLDSSVVATLKFAGFLEGSAHMNTRKIQPLELAA